MDPASGVVRDIAATEEKELQLQIGSVENQEQLYSLRVRAAVVETPNLRSRSLACSASFDLG